MKIAIKKGFTLIEVLLVIALIAILAGITIVAINPAKQYGNATNAERQSHVNTILNAIHQYAVDNQGILPDTIPDGISCESNTGVPEDDGICVTGVGCAQGIDLSVLTDSERYLVSMPLNPGYSTEEHTGYNVIKSSNGRITVCAPYTELDATISATR